VGRTFESCLEQTLNPLTHNELRGFLCCRITIKRWRLININLKGLIFFPRGLPFHEKIFSLHSLKGIDIYTEILKRGGLSRGHRIRVSAELEEVLKDVLHVIQSVIVWCYSISRQCTEDQLSKWYIGCELVSKH
jgi:hypothetical protein